MKCGNTVVVEEKNMKITHFLIYDPLHTVKYEVSNSEHSLTTVTMTSTNRINSYIAEDDQFSIHPLFFTSFDDYDSIASLKLLLEKSFPGRFEDFYREFEDWIGGNSLVKAARD